MTDKPISEFLAIARYWVWLIRQPRPTKQSMAIPWAFFWWALNGEINPIDGMKSK
jgi:hypothetical protein